MLYSAVVSPVVSFSLSKTEKKIILKKTSCLLLLKAIVFVSGEINTHFSMNSPLKSQSD